MINLGNAKINKFSTNSKLSYDGLAGQTVMLKEGEGDINGEPLKAGETYTLKGGEVVTIYSGKVEQNYNA